MNLYVIIRTQFEGVHCWPECNVPGVEFLRNPHRHTFHVEAKFRVTHTDRDREFIDLKRCINTFVTRNYEVDLGRMSCEDLACDILSRFEQDNCVSVKVFEDNENGAEAYV